MFKKILVANRGEIAVRVIRTCREMGIQTVAIYEAADQGSLHVRLADECVLLKSPYGFMDQDAILQIAQKKGADAIHPGYGYLAEEPDFIRACEGTGIAFIGPPAAVVEATRGKVNALKHARAAGFVTTEYSQRWFDEDEFDALHEAAQELGYPLVVKSCRGGRGRGERLVRYEAQLPEAVRSAQAESQVYYGDARVYLERAILAAHQVSVQVLADHRGNAIHLGEREGSVLQGNQKLLEEAPAPCLNQAEREELWQTALDLTRLFNYENVGTVEFLVDENRDFYFAEIKARIQTEHPLTEMLTGVDLVREQIRLAAGELLSIQQRAVSFQGWAMQCRISAQDPAKNFMPSPGLVRRMRLPSGPGVRVDTFAYSGCNIPSEYDPLIAKLLVWGADRAQCLQRITRALHEIKLTGIATNLPLLQLILDEPSYGAGAYTTDLTHRAIDTESESASEQRALAIAAAIYYARANEAFHPTMPERFTTGWHRDSRRLS